MHLHILGICGTFMGGIASLAKELGHQVSGSDNNIYPPMSTQLEELGIVIKKGYFAQHLTPKPDLVIIGNALSRGNPAIEEVLNQHITYTSGPEWLKHNILKDRWVLAVAGTHGKTTTTSMLSWILHCADKAPGYLIGGVPLNFDHSAKLGNSPYFVVEADEYDTAFFDKRSKFVHYLPTTLILNNLEFDHADIFADLQAIKTQFHHLIRTLPSNGLIIQNKKDPHIQDVLALGCWTAQQSFSAGDWQATEQNAHSFDVQYKNEKQGNINWHLTGEHNVNNALAAIAAAHHAEVSIDTACQALCQFKNVKRRMELLATIDNITLYDDFAHHPTAIATTIKGLRKKIGNQRIIVILELRSNTMKMGVHKALLSTALVQADRCLLFQPDNLTWSLSEALQTMGRQAITFNTTEAILLEISQTAKPGDNLIIMSNGSFENLPQRLITHLRNTRKYTH